MLDQVPDAQRRVSPDTNARTRTEWAQLISAEWQAGIDYRLGQIKSHVKTGQLLQRSKDELDHGDFGKMFERREVPFGQDQAERLMAIARHPVLRNSAHARKLPPALYTLFLLTKLPDEALTAMLADGRINPEIERKDVEHLLKERKPPRDEVTGLIAKLKTVEPAIAVNQIIPLLTCFWFTGEQLMAYNDQIGIALPFRSEFRGAASGNLPKLIEMAAFDNTFKMEAEDGNLVIRNAENNRVRIRLAMLDPEFQFKMPTLNRRNCFRQISEIVAAVEHCLISIGTDTSVAEQLGVTLVPQQGRVSAYSTDDHTFSCAIIRSDIGLDERAILPGLFCRAMVALSKRGLTPLHFEIGESESERYALFSAGDVTLYGRIISARSPLNFEAIYDFHSPDRLQLIDIPARFHRAMEFVGVICNADRRSARIKIRSGSLSVHVHNDTEEIEERMPVDRTHPEVAVAVEPRFLERGAPFQKFMITDRCVVMSDGDADRLYLVGTR